MKTRSGLGQLLLTVPLLLVAGNGKAQDIIPDTTLGAESSIATPLTPQQVQIDGGAIRGTNLFHSFLEFNINEGNAAYFANPAGIANIFSRVTGPNPSHLLGTLGVSGDANLFFLNPNGILFGPNAQLDIAGSFVASTANRFVFADGRQFGAISPENAPLLTVTASAPVGLRFEGREGGAIVNAGDLAVPEGESLGLIGGTVVSTGTLAAPQGNVTAMAVPGSGQVQLSPAGQVTSWQSQTPTSPTRSAKETLKSYKIFEIGR